MRAAGVFGLAVGLRHPLHQGRALRQIGRHGPERLDHALTGGETSIPYGWVDFCRRQPQECSQPVLLARDVALNAANWKALSRINREVNAAIEPVSNYDH